MNWRLSSFRERSSAFSALSFQPRKRLLQGVLPASPAGAYPRIDASPADGRKIW